VPARIATAFTLGATPNMSPAFSEDQICQTRLALGLAARLDLPLMRLLTAEAVIEPFVEPAGVRCVDGLLPPPPPVGAFTRRYELFPDRITGSSFLSTAIRLAVVPVRRAEAEVRVYSGLGRLWPQRILVPHVGATIATGRGPARFLLEGEVWFYSVPLHTIEEQFLDGQVVSRQETVRGIGQHTMLLRGGVSVSL
jgi:hypothetical protein